MSTTPSPGDLPVRRIDRILAFMSLGLLVLSIACFFAIMIASGSGMKQADFGDGIWPIVSLVVYVAPPIAFVLLLTLLIMTFVRRARANKGR
ncbi:multidrug ABC transporter ATPase [Microbacterium sp.]|uniref:multidrug ABC transporter ATPase n=1 Tax=Microbacterium sp. TaxID=51671 RepID=UPI003735F7FF